jgi:uncharacterized tellurite resistance protein B-like protein
MSIAALGNILKIFGGSVPTAAERQQIVKEALLMTLARATSSDTNIKSIEVSAVQKTIKAATGDDVSESDVRVAAHSELFETTPLASALAKLSASLEPADRALIANSLASIIKSDSHISDQEVRFFDEVAGALKIKPSELVGLIP